MIIDNDLTANLWGKDISKVDFSPHTSGKVKVRDLSQHTTRTVNENEIL